MKTKIIMRISNNQLHRFGRRFVLFLISSLLCMQSSVLSILGFSQRALALAAPIERASVSSAGTQSTGGGSDTPSISSDGRYVAFESAATNLVASDSNSQWDIFVRNRQTGTTTRVSTDSSGTQSSGGGSFDASISGDGRYVAYRSSATNLVASDTNSAADIFVKDRQTGTTTRVSTDSSGTESTGGSSFEPSISSDGRYVAFYSTATNLVASDTNSAADIFVKDRQTGTTTRVSTDSSGTQSNGGSYDPAISLDGRYVAFYGEASNLVASDTNSEWDVFVKDLLLGVTTRASTDSSGAQGNGDSGYRPSISGNGRYVAFRSDATNLIGSDTNSLGDIFVKDLSNGTTTRASTDSTGTQSTTGNSNSPSLSNDGRYVAFQSLADNLVASDTNGWVDIFVKDRQTGTTTRVSTDSTGAQTTDNDSYDVSISADGRYISFYSDATNLVPSDSNSFSDIFVKTYSEPTTLGDNPTGRSLTISSSQMSATNVDYVFTFTLPSTSPLQAIRLRFCTTPGNGACTQPTGMDVSGYSVSSQTFSEATSFTAQTANENQCTVATGSNDEYEVCLERNDGDSETATQKTLTLTGITNPSVTGTIYVRITLYANDIFSAAGRINDGAVATSINQVLTISARVQEVLDFCIANTTVDDGSTFLGNDCTGITGTNGSIVDLGAVDNTTTSAVTPDSDGNSRNGSFMVRTNAVNGVIVGYRALQSTGTNYLGSLRIFGANCNGSANTVGSGGSSSDQCFNANSTKTALSTSVEQFGMTGRYINRSSSQTPTTNLALSTDYDSTSTVGYAWNEDGTFTIVASSTGSADKVVDDEAVILKFAAVTALTTPTGQYSTQAEFIATPTY